MLQVKYNAWLKAWADSLYKCTAHIFNFIKKGSGDTSTLTCLVDGRLLRSRIELGSCKLLTHSNVALAVTYYRVSRITRFIR